LDQVSKTHDPETFAKASGHPDWDTTMNEKYRSSLVEGKSPCGQVDLLKEIDS
jgi:hypothetical protein